MSGPLTVTIGGVLCTIEEEGGIAESWGDQGEQTTVYLQCAWADRRKVVKGLLGSVTLTPGTGKFVQVLPFVYPDNPSIRCTSIGEVKGKAMVRDSRGWAAYKKCVVPANFSRPSWGEISQDKKTDNLPAYTTVAGTSAPEVFSPPGGTFYMPDLSGVPIGETNLGLIRPHCEITMTREKLPYPPLDANMFLQGTLNDEEIRFFDRVFPRGCLMYMGMSFDPETDQATGEQTYTVKYKFLGNYTVEFNQAMGVDGEWHYLNSKADGSGDPPFFYERFTWFFEDDLDPPAPSPNELVVIPPD
jgi:hypothetical protein